MNLCNHRSGIGPGGLAMDMGGYGGGGIQDLLGEGTCVGLESLKLEVWHQMIFLLVDSLSSIV